MATLPARSSLELRLRGLVAFMLLTTAGLTSALCAADDETAVGRVLDALHERAARADFDGYFDLYHPGAVFLGTDPTEHWTLAELRAYARPHFEQGRGWIYRPTERVIHTAGDAAWFEERLQHETYGETRGTGVLLKTDDVWRVAQYNLTLPIPNALFRDISATVADYNATQAGEAGHPTTDGP